MRRSGREGRREHKARAELESPPRFDLDHVCFFERLAGHINPPNVRAGIEVAFGRKPVVPLPLPRSHQQLPNGFGWHAHLDRPRTRPHDASRATVCTSFTPSNFSMRRDSCASESISTVADTTAVLSSYTWTSSADMFTRFSATIVAMSRSRPCRSQASILIATGYRCVASESQSTGTTRAASSALTALMQSALWTVTPLPRVV